ncbi:hypothetical protein RB195_014670 [Necator americanus]|uniref:Uncharacterized protein n=1 Tax=Necator americanus TaxID=51031 RepID=A0ABR1E135_NECAM
MTGPKDEEWRRNFDNMHLFMLDYGPGMSLGMQIPSQSSRHRRKNEKTNASQDLPPLRSMLPRSVRPCTFGGSYLSRMTPRRDYVDDVEEEDLRAYEVDGWRVGYEVVMNGVGFAEVREDSSDSDDESVDDSGETTEASPYPEYRTLPMQIEEPVAGNARTSKDSEEDYSHFENSNLSVSEVISAVDTNATPSITMEFEQCLRDSLSSSEISSHEEIPHMPTNITLDSEKIEAIRSAMSGLSLPPPPHMVNLDDNQLCEFIREKIEGSRV